MDAVIRYSGGKQYEITTRGHKIVCDQPAENGGEDKGMTPPELLLASLGSCAAYYAVEYLRNHAMPADDVTVRVQADKSSSPARLGHFRVEIEVPEAIEHSRQTGVLKAATACLIHNTLRHPPEIEIAVNSRPPRPKFRLAS